MKLFRFHLGSYLLSIIAGGILVGANFQERSVYSDKVPGVIPGIPVPELQYGYPWVVYRKWMLLNLKDCEWSTHGFIFNILFILFMMLLVGVISELLLRKRSKSV